MASENRKDGVSNFLTLLRNKDEGIQYLFVIICFLVLHNFPSFIAGLKRNTLCKTIFFTVPSA